MTSTVITLSMKNYYNVKVSRFPLQLTKILTNIHKFYSPSHTTPISAWNISSFLETGSIKKRKIWEPPVS